MTSLNTDQREPNSPPWDGSSPLPFSAEEQGIGDLLVDWFAKNQRTLPWRNHPSIYHRLVSEFMLQQTQVATVIPYFERWIKLFPSIEKLAQAQEIQVLKAWEGLGYYSRAKNLHRTAKQIVAHAPREQENIFPQTVQNWLRYPGIGDYTAHALLAIAQNYPVAAVDGNVIRLFSRLEGIQRTFGGKQQASQYFKPIAQAHIPPGKSAAYNEAIMEFGALICRPKNPLCDRCPIGKYCRSFSEKLDLTSIPKFKKMIRIEKTMQRIFLCDGQWVLLKKTEGKRLDNIFELPPLDEIHEICGKIPMETTGKINRSIGRERIRETILRPKYLPENWKEASHQCPGLYRFSIPELENIPLSGPHRRWLDGQFSPLG
ncbi:MAG: A/G-specific adenine glycosylase [Puniceicoccales bacterium]|nr:A/G-specific adenine glycosylase [Puniceicoccales bacterium]